MTSPLLKPMAALLLARTTLNVAARMAYPFLPFIARGLGVPLETAATLVALRAATGYASLGMGPMADRYRRRTVILIAIALFILGALVAAGFSRFWLFAVGFIIMGLAKVLLDPTTIAYISDRVAYELRGRATGILEIPWAAAGLLGMPLVGWAIARYGWQAPYWGLAGLGILSLGVAMWAFPAGDRASHPHSGHVLASLGRALRVPNVRWMWPLMLCLLLGNEALFIVYGAWLEGQFGLGAAALGSVSIATGLAELGGEGLSSAFLDRMGKKRGILLGLLALAATYPLLPVLAGVGVAGAVLVLALILLTFEFTLVSTIPLVSEMTPTARATTLSVNSTAMQTGRVAGALLGPWMFQTLGIWGNVSLAAALTLMAALVLVARVHEAHQVG